MKLKDKIIDILMEELCEVNCNSCDAEYCEDCNRKEQNWGIGYHKAEKIADRIFELTNNSNKKEVIKCK